jgi:ParB family transcriptional regulator, chromosome partitioning protein
VSDDEKGVHSEPRPRLGRGLAALLGASQAASATQAPPNGAPSRVPIEFLRPNPRNPRRRFDDAELSELSDSIRERGILQPVLVRRISDTAGEYEIVAGERRWRAAQRAGQHDVPIVVLELSDREALEAAIVENVQRIDLNALEEAAGFAQLGSEYGYSHAEIARVVGKSRSHVANTLRLVALPDHSRQLLAGGHISAGHARALLPLGDPDKIADLIVSKQLSVRDVERMAESNSSSNEASKDVVHRRHRVDSSVAGDPDTTALQQKLELGLGTNVLIRHNGKSGELRIAFRDFDQLEALCKRLVQST